MGQDDMIAAAFEHAKRIQAEREAAGKPPLSFEEQQPMFFETAKLYVADIKDVCGHNVERWLGAQAALVAVLELVRVDLAMLDDPTPLHGVIPHLAKFVDAFVKLAAETS